VDNIKMDFRKIRWSGMGRIILAQELDQWNVLNVGAARIVGRFSIRRTTGGRSRRVQLHGVGSHAIWAR
jgi:hypothetical protein